MKKLGTYITLLFVAFLILLLPSVKEDISCSLKESIDLCGETVENQACIKQQKQNPLPLEFTDGKPFLKVETNRENKQHLTKRILLRKTATSAHVPKQNISYNWIITQYRNNRHSILRKNNYYLYALCRIII